MVSEFTAIQALESNNWNTMEAIEAYNDDPSQFKISEMQISNRKQTDGGNQQTPTQTPNTST